MKIGWVIVGGFVGVILIACSAPRETQLRPSERNFTYFEEYERESAAYSEAERANTKEGYEHFIKQYPRSTYLKSAQERNLRQIMQAEELAYSQATFLNYLNRAAHAIDLYRRFIRTYPEGEFVADAKLRLAKLDMVTEADFSQYVTFRLKIAEMISGGELKLLRQKKIGDITSGHSLVVVESLDDEAIRLSINGSTSIVETIGANRQKTFKLINGKYNIAVWLDRSHLASRAYIDVGYDYKDGEYSMIFAYAAPSKGGSNELYATRRSPSFSDRRELVYESLEDSGVNVFRQY